MQIKTKLAGYLLLTLMNTSFASNANQETVLPLKFNTGNSAPYGMTSTVITIEGKQFPVIFDTGAKNFEILLTKQALENLHVTYTHTQVCSRGLNSKHCHETFIIPEIKLGSFTLKHVKGAVLDKLWGGHDETFEESEASRNGMIGYALLSKFNVLLDYPHSKAILTKPHHKPSAYDTTHWTSINFKDQLITTLIINGKKLNFSWDTGAIPSVINQSLFTNQQQLPCPTKAPYANNCLSIITTSLITTENKPLPNSWFQTIKIPDYAPFDGLVGSNFYAENLVYFDFDQHTIYVKPTAASF